MLSYRGLRSLSNSVRRWELLVASDHQYAIIKLSKSYFQKINEAKFEKKKF